MTSRANSDQHLFDAMITLKRHLRSCGKCSVARKAADPYLMCRAGLNLTLRAADRYDLLISLRVKAHASEHDTVFACPDTSAHGSAYALTAQPLLVTGVQEGMF
jgi:hypothetical protein